MESYRPSDLTDEQLQEVQIYLSKKDFNEMYRRHGHSLRYDIGPTSLDTTTDEFKEILQSLF